MSKTITTGFLADTINGIKINTSIQCNSANYLKCTSREVSYIVIHYTGNSKDSAKANANHFHNAYGTNASAHYFVDDNEIYQSVALHDRAYHCGAKSYKHNEARNANSFGIEMCCTAGNYKVSSITQKNAAYLCAYLCQMINIKSEQVDKYVIRHYDVTGKKCPAQFVDNESEWDSFKLAVKTILGGKANNDTERQYPVPVATLKKGSVGESVKWLQQSLNKINNYGLIIDGSFGNATLQAVLDFQDRYGLETDGSVGQLTRAAIIDVLEGNKQEVEKVEKRDLIRTNIANEEKYIWDYLYKQIGNTYGVAGIMGNLYAESGLKSNNLQNDFEKKLGCTDEQYVAAVDNKTYNNFTNDKAGFGICQWTFYTRKQNLLNFAISKNTSIADLPMQLEFLMKELTTSYSSLLTNLKSAKSVKSASDAVLTQFEKPKDQSAEVKKKRAKYSQVYFDKYAITVVKTKYIVYSKKYFTLKSATQEYNLLKKIGYNSCSLYKNGMIYRVKIGEYATYNSAVTICNALIKAGHSASVEKI